MCQTSGTTTKDYSVSSKDSKTCLPTFQHGYQKLTKVPNNSGKNLLTDQRYKICYLPLIRRLQLKMCSGSRSLQVHRSFK